jgi:hypothetical protein
MFLFPSVFVFVFVGCVGFVGVASGLSVGMGAASSALIRQVALLASTSATLAIPHKSADMWLGTQFEVQLLLNRFSWLVLVSFKAATKSQPVLF